MSTYVFDQAWQRERDRLTALESLYDGGSRRLLEALGLSEGWRCLEVGCGAGGLALWLADRVGEAGHVLATDLDTRFLEGHGRANLEVRTHDIVTDPLDEAPFDVIHTRAVVEHVADREQVIKHLAGALRPGGWLLIEEVDFGGSTAGMLAEYVSAPEPQRAAMERIYLAVAQVFAAIGADPSYGRRLVGALTDAGLARVTAELHAPVVTGGDEQWTRGSIEQLAGPIVASGHATVEDVEWFLARSAEPDFSYLPPLMVSAWGQRDPHEPGYQRPGPAFL
jgi:2-polyprenyl-3-methyl-5-hydroxy-6-metoxy-1,4-benzoquinol methylase